MKVVSRAAGQAVVIEPEALVLVIAIEDERVRLGVRCPADWEVRQIELDSLKRGPGSRPWRAAPDPLWQAPESSRDQPAAAPASPSSERRTRFFLLPANGGLKIGPLIRLQVAAVKERFAVLGIDGVADEQVREV